MLDFKLFYKTNYRVIYSYCNKILDSSGVIDHEEAARDFTSESFIAVWETWERYEEYRHAKAYAFISARNKCFNHIQTGRRHDKAHKEILYLSSEMDSLSDYALINAEVMDYLWLQLNKLSPARKEILTLLFAGLNSTQVAKKMHTTRKTVLNQKGFAINQLKKLVLLKFG